MVTRNTNPEHTIVLAEQEVEENERDGQRHSEKEFLCWCKMRQSSHVYYSYE